MALLVLVQSIYRVIRHHSTSLITSIADPLDLAWKLFANKIIEAATKDEVDLPNLTVTKKNSILVSAVMRRVEARPSLFHQFVDVLKDNGDHILRELGEKLETTYSEFNTCTYRYTGFRGWSDSYIVVLLE